MQIVYRNLWTFSGSEMTRRMKAKIEPRIEKLPISKLRKTDTVSISGEFEIRIGDRKLWIIGNASAPEQMKIDVWLYWLTTAFTRLEEGEPTYSLCTGEQGGAVYLFEREGEMLYLSVFRAHDRDPFEPGEPMEGWQRVPMTYESFRRGFLDFRRRLYNELKAQAPEGYRLYFKEDLPSED
ncbi:hypothetical protein ACFFSY_11535 [Paenibacillus aurantiacus]|uniref:Uncharacterized protein n=1 Tax=Paenibacillus aurantiacus TaxID=1936118 RepID=A0ABV5KPL9_9BACL